MIISLLEYVYKSKKQIIRQKVQLVMLRVKLTNASLFFSYSLAEIIGFYRATQLC